MTATDYATHADFLAACGFWRENGYAPLPFADWFDEHELPGQAAGWRWAAGGYDGATPMRWVEFDRPAGVPGRWTWPRCEPLNSGRAWPVWPAKFEFHEAVRHFLDAWSALGLSAEQLEAARTLLTSAEQVRTLGGFAGTGKSRVVQHLHHARPDYHVCAFTGKAVDVLRQLGIGRAATIHSLIYDREGKEPNVRWVRRTARNLPGVTVGYPGRTDVATYHRPRGFIIDEASMVSKAEFDVLASYGLPIIAVGDHGQLPPVGEDAGLMREPMVRLETVHRNAGPIARFAEHLRRGGRPWEFSGKTEAGVETEAYTKVLVMSADKLLPTSLLAADQIICGRNKTRVALNRKVRRLRFEVVGNDEAGGVLLEMRGPQIGDRVICTRNHRGYGVFNGQQGVITALGQDPGTGTRYYGNHADAAGPGAWLAWRTGSAPGEEISGEIPYHPDAWHSEKGVTDDDRARRLVPFDYAYAVTCHKAQGSEFDKVVVFEERLPETDSARWNYTAASRAKKAVIWVTG